eukprot:TRINITY_DN39782_c0_g1_i1.p2 TRINITY_DN39782_c0_g1~~TRINITY_DN39782_c0_g1_i1.p2  ORF type:complete len:164 (+),score=24.86 TRINITY_DN39782_c0_g1_i1:73-492(+)
MSTDEQKDQPIQFARGGVVLPGSATTTQDQSQKETKPMVISYGKLPHQTTSQKFQVEQKKQKTEENTVKMRPGGEKKGKQQPRMIDQVMEQMMKENERRQQQAKQQQLQDNNNNSNDRSNNSSRQMGTKLNRLLEYKMQ